MSTTVNATVPVAGIGPVAVTATDRGTGPVFLLLHGGAGPQSVDGFADLLADTAHVRVIAPVHPGFGGTPRPEALTTIRDLAALYDGLLTELDLTGVTVVGGTAQHVHPRPVRRVLPRTAGHDRRGRVTLRGGRRRGDVALRHRARDRLRTMNAKKAKSSGKAHFAEQAHNRVVVSPEDSAWSAH